MRAMPRHKIKETVQCFGDLFGVSVTVELDPGQSWVVSKRGSYWAARRKDVKLRLTDTAFKKLFMTKKEAKHEGKT